MTQIGLSIDDVLPALEALHAARYDSPFRQPFFRALKAAHRRYGMCFTLYVCQRNERFSLSMLDARYRAQFAQNADWLKFGYHARTLDSDAPGDPDFKSSYDDTVNALREIVGPQALTDTLRLHRFAASAVQVEFLRGRGVQCLLCADDARVSYDLSDQEAERLRADGCAVWRGMRYLRTDFRLEHVRDVRAELTRRAQNAQNTPNARNARNVQDARNAPNARNVHDVHDIHIEVFTHERYFAPRRVLPTLAKLMRMGAWARKNGARFIAP